MEKAIYQSNSVEETISIAKQFTTNLQAGSCVLLSGDLGAGKTHFVKGMALALGISDTITSPTFTLHNCYYGTHTLNHFDFYRIDDEEEVEMLGLNELFVTDNGIAVIEWHSRITGLLPRKVITVTIDKTGDNSRTITIE